MLSIAMEVFEEFCRAKTNFYILEKVGGKGVSVHKPSWFAEDKVMVSTASTCGLTKGGRLLPLVDPKTGARIQVPDPETGEPVDAVNDQLFADMQALATGASTDTLRFIERSNVSMRTAVPVYYDRRFENAFGDALRTPAFQGFSAMTIGELIPKRLIKVRGVMAHHPPTSESAMYRISRSRTCARA
jgi:hypothetical protein